MSFSNGKNQLASINDIFIFMNKDFFNESTPSSQSWKNCSSQKINKKITE